MRASNTPLLTARPPPPPPSYVSNSDDSVRTYQSSSPPPPPSSTGSASGALVPIGVLAVLLVAASVMAIVFGVLWGNSAANAARLETRITNVEKGECNLLTDVSVCDNNANHPDLMCDDSELNADLLKAVSEPLKVQRSSLGVLEISGGTFEQMMYAYGYEMTRDRLFQMYFNIKAFTGELSTMIGSPGVANDRAIIVSSYSNAEYIADFNSQPSVYKLASSNMLNGINQRIVDVLASGPMPADFTALSVTPTVISLAKYLQFSHQVGLAFSGQGIEYSRSVTHLTTMQQLIAGGRNITDARAIVNDIYNKRSIRHSIVDDAEVDAIQCPSSSKRRTTVTVTSFNNNNNNKQQQQQHGKDVTCTLEEVVDEMDNLTAVREQYGVYKGGSWGVVVSGNKTKTGKPMMISGPQASLNTIPSFIYFAKITNKELGLDMVGSTTPGLLFNSANGLKGGRNGYSFVASGQVGSLPGLPALLEDSSADLFLRTETIQVAGGANQTQDVYISPHGGHVLTRNIVSASLWNGTKSLVRKDVAYADIFSGHAGAILVQFSKSICQLRNIVRGARGNNNKRNLAFPGFDNDCNIFFTELGGFYDVGQDFVPQGILDQPIITTPKKTSYFVVNPEGKNVIGHWNTPMVQSVPSSYGDAELTRFDWIERAIAAKDKIGFSEAQDILVSIGQCMDEGSADALNTGQNYGTHSFVPLFRSLFFDAISVYPTADRLTARAILESFDGYPINGTRKDMIYSRNWTDAFVLASRWVKRVETAVEAATIGGNTAPLRPLIFRVLNATSVNPLRWPGWKSSIADKNLLIVTALDASIASLGGLVARPWGINRRPLVTYTSASFSSTLSFEDRQVPAANRAAGYHICELLPGRRIQTSGVVAFGVSGLILNATAPVIQDLSMHKAYIAYQPSPI